MGGRDRYRGLARYYDIFVDWDKRLAQELPFLLEVSGIRWKGQVRALDIGCGSGRHMQALRESGCQVEGLEPSSHLRRLAEKNVPGALIHPRGMEQLAGVADRRGPWDLVTCLGNTLPHLSPEKLVAFLTGLRAAVGESGCAVVHLLNYGKIMSLRPAALAEKAVRREDGDWRFQREYTYHENSLDFTVRVWRDGVLAAENRETLYPLTAAFLHRKCAAAGFERIDAFGGFDPKLPYGSDSDNLVLCLAAGLTPAE